MLYVSIITFTYFLAVPITIFVAIDGYKRKNKWLLWSLGTILSWPLILPLYFSFRNLKKEEKRTGGLIWNIIRNYILIYSTNIFLVILLLLILPQNMGYLSNEIFITEFAGFEISLSFIYYVIFIIWLIPSLLFLMIGSFFKDDYSKETGPTGKLKESRIKKKEELSKKLDEFYEERQEES
ncbi:MAG TPA: hypothetical protein VKN64_08110 [Halanaerobiales bacterium]|nr:hypothetical protein [Halanaerobiales bacterium]